MITLAQLRRERQAISPIRRVLRKFEHLYTSGINNRTPTALAEEIISQIDVDWTRPDLRFLDVKSNCGTFSLLLIEKLLDAGHNINYILDQMIYAADADQRQIWLTEASFKQAFGRGGNIIHTNLLTWQTDMKFDLIVGNPPFKKLAENGRPTASSLWKLFIIKGQDLLKEGAVMSLVHPNGWCYPSDSHKLIDTVFSRSNLKYADISTVASHFKGVGSTFGYTILTKEPYSGTTTIRTDDGEIDIDIRKTRLIIPAHTSIIKKITETDHPRCNFKKIGNNGYTGKWWIAGDKNQPNKPAWATVKVVNSYSAKKSYDKEVGASVVWGDHHTPSQSVRKVTLPYCGHPDVVVDDGTVDVICGTLWMEISDSASIDAVCSVFHSKLFKFFSLKKLTQYNEPKNVNLFPQLSFDRVWTDAEIYDEFGLNGEERRIVEGFDK